VNQRYDQVDALRGLAVMGILFVNTLGQAYGSQALHLGYFFNGQGLGEQASMFLVAALFEGKFYPIFAFLFGASFALQARGARRLGIHEARSRFTRRLAWLLAAGVLHAAFLFYGDILFTYALAGLLLRDALLKSASEQLGILRTVAMFMAGVMVISLVLNFAFNDRDILDEMARDSAAAFALVGQGAWHEMVLSRLKSFALVQFSSLLYLPMFFGYFLLGSLAVRLGWLTRPHRHRTMWQKVLWIGLVIGLPLNLYFAGASVSIALNPLEREAWQSLASWSFEISGSLLAAAYVAAFLLYCRRPPQGMQAMGRMALTNYLMQSLIAMLVFQSPFLALGPGLLRPYLLAYCLAVIALQWWWSKAWLAYRYHGPLEALWRRFTRSGDGYRGESPK
jgi:uncharacterized protein